jgi:hypothetical protein
MTLLRPYQVEVVDRFERLFGTTAARPLIVSPTGAGNPPSRSARSFGRAASPTPKHGGPQHDPPRLSPRRIAMRVAARSAVAGRHRCRRCSAQAGWITPEQAVETLADCDCLQLISPEKTNGKT